MKILRRIACGVFAIGIILGLAIPARSDVPVIYYQGTLTATGSSLVLNLANQSTCSMVLSGTWVGTVTPKGSSDKGATFVTVSSIGAQTSNGTYSGDISAYTTQFKISWTRTSGTLAYVISCSGAVSTANVTVTAANVTVVNTPGVVVASAPPINLGGATPTPLPVTTPPPTTTVTVNTPAPCSASTCNTTVSLSGATPTPLPVRPLDLNGNQTLTNATPGDSVATNCCGNSTSVFGIPQLFDGTSYARAISCPNTATVNISTATTTSIVAVSGSTAVYICSYSLYVVGGTLPSFQFEYGTGAACVTTQVVIGGTFGGVAGAVGELFNSPPVGPQGYLLKTPTAKAFCLVSGGTSPNIQGYITWTQFAPT